MPEDFLNPESSSPFLDRRKAARVGLKSVAYVELEPGNGGLILNLCEDGIAVQAAEPIIDATFPRLRFCLPNSTKWIEIEGELVWEGASRKEAGIRFVGISAEARAQIRNYLNGANASLEVRGDADSPDVAEQEPHSLELAEEVGLSAEIDSMFPSEKEIASGKCGAPAVHRSTDFFPEAAADAPFSRDRVPLEPAVGTLESDIPAEEGRPNQSDLHRYRAPARPRPVVGVDQARIDGSHPQSNTETSSNGPGSAMPVPNFRHPPPGPSGSPSSNSLSYSSPNSFIGPKGHDLDGDRAAHERLVAAFAAASNSASTHSNTPPQARLSNENARGPSDHPPIAFSGFGYQPSEFEEPFGKKWIGVAAALVALMAIGVVLAVGPANVKDLIFRRHAIFESLAGPPPPSLPAKQTEKPDAAADATASEKAAQPATSPAAVPSDAPDVQSSPSAADPAPSIDPSLQDSTSTSDERYGGGGTADSEAEVLKFQREHSQTRSTDTEIYRAPAGGSVTYPKPYISASSVPPVASTTDPRRDPSLGGASGNSPPSRSASEANRAPSDPPQSTIQTRQPGNGVVAIRSSFNAVRGIDAGPSETSEPSPNDGPLVPGQLKTMHQPNYPAEALRAHIEGTVTLRATVDRTGVVQAVQLIGGPPILVPAAIEAARQWRYAPTTLNGHAVECTEDISMVFRMANSVAAPH